MKKRMLSLLLAVALVLGLCPSVFAAGSSYADVLDTHWAHPYIEDVTEKGIMNGVDDKNFAPEDAMTRAMFVTVLARLSGDTLTEQTSFSDVPAGQWYSAAVSWAAENGIVLGYPDGTFAPDKAVSREDAMTLLVRFAGWKALTLPEGGELTYADAASIQDYAKEAVAAATAAGILAGYPDGTFLPQKSITRAEAAKILSTLMKVTDYTPVEPTEPSEEPTEEPTPSPEPVPDSPLPSWEELQRTLYETNAYCAALYLGRSSAASLSDALPEFLAQKGLDGISYLADIAASACVEQPGDEVFILIPRGDKVLSLYNYVLETQSNYDAYPGALLYSSAKRCAVALRCNESDVRPNVLAVFSGLDGEQSFSPRITLENETLLSAPGVYTLIPR